MLKKIRNTFLAGLIALLPIFVTFYFVIGIFLTVDRLVRPIVPYRIPGLGFVASLFLIFAAGVIGKNVFGRRLMNQWERFMGQIPLVKQIYTTIKQIMDAFVNTSAINAFKDVVLVEYPRKGLFQLGFITNTEVERISQAIGAEVFNVFLPTTPNPTSGMLVMVPKEDVIFLDISIEEGIKLILSGGVITPAKRSDLEHSET